MHFKIPCIIAIVGFILSNFLPSDGTLFSPRFLGLYSSSVLALIVFSVMSKYPWVTLGMTFIWFVLAPFIKFHFSY